MESTNQILTIPGFFQQLFGNTRKSVNQLATQEGTAINLLCPPDEIHDALDL